MTPRLRRGDSAETSRGDAAGAAWIVRGGGAARPQCRGRGRRRSDEGGQRSRWHTGQASDRVGKLVSMMTGGEDVREEALLALGPVLTRSMALMSGTKTPPLGMRPARTFDARRRRRRGDGSRP